MPLLSRAPVLLLIAFALWNNHAAAQAGVATLGFQLKPVVVMDYFDPSVEAE